MKTTGLMILMLLVLSGIAFSRTCYADDRSDADQYESDAKRYRHERDELQKELQDVLNDPVIRELKRQKEAQRVWEEWKKCTKDYAYPNNTKNICGEEPPKKLAQPVWEEWKKCTKDYPYPHNTSNICGEEPEKE